MELQTRFVASFTYADYQTWDAMNIYSVNFMFCYFAIITAVVRSAWNSHKLFVHILCSAPFVGTRFKGEPMHRYGKTTEKKIHEMNKNKLG